MSILADKITRVNALISKLNNASNAVKEIKAELDSVMGYQENGWATTGTVLTQHGEEVAYIDNRHNRLCLYKQLDLEDTIPLRVLEVLIENKKVLDQVGK